jgi:ATP-binding cassette subfamily B protein
VLDNPMSSVDVHTEAAIEDSLRGILRDRTALLIAHRPSTLLLADRVALISDGRIVATGTHTELLATVPLYREVLAKDVEAEEVSV